MNIDVIIPTFDRLELLKKTIDTILKGSHKEITIFVVLDGNPKLITPILKMPVAMIYNEARRDWIFSTNRALKYARSDAVFYGADDLEIPPHFFREAAKALKAHFPRLDGLIGTAQEPRGVTSAFGLMGREFINHFPGRQVFCPDFVHFGSDFEIGRYARNINKFYTLEQPIITHNRPKDSTREISKKVRAQDKDISKIRRKRGLIWGVEFERVA